MKVTKRQLADEVSCPGGAPPLTELPVEETRDLVRPWTARADNPQSRLHEQSVILAAALGIARLAQTKRFHLRPLGIGQNESFHPKLESPVPQNQRDRQETLRANKLANRLYDTYEAIIDACCDAYVRFVPNRRFVSA
jgi:hypothetical protein